MRKRGSMENLPQVGGKNGNKRIFKASLSA